MLGYELFKGLEDLSQSNINHIVDVLNEFFEQRSVVVTGCFLKKDGEIVATEWDNHTKNNDEKTHTGLLFDITLMGDRSLDDGKPIVGNLFRRLDINKEYQLAKEMKMLKDEVNKFKSYEFSHDVKDHVEYEDPTTEQGEDHE